MTYRKTWLLYRSNAFVKDFGILTLSGQTPADVEGGNPGRGTRAPKGSAGLRGLSRRDPRPPKGVGLEP